MFIPTMTFGNYIITALPGTVHRHPVIKHRFGSKGGNNNFPWWALKSDMIKDLKNPKH